ncbi:MAG: hypothetical protein JWM28_1962, partial [Chitinophagaceae bacterium]|nr:hypothetical protein [Chitinophagaceae bacterium]
KWITDVVVGCNFCPYAAREIKRNSIHYEVVLSPTLKNCLEALLHAFHQLDNETAIETLFLILPDTFASFEDYLQLVELSEKLLDKEGYEGIYQIASFHPQYLFAGSSPDDAANYTNRSPYPMLHLLREESVSRAIENYPYTENIPQKNIEFARNKGLAYMRSLSNSSIRDL